ncbi:unnamed protein product [Paramecium pentaurelia]|uniref:Serine carboxypeptidase n=1 Tax=Paramecium pentaurelia TaxID=43138 RepID=A0A8S1U4X8_9CILI|nr:unnamed protein product [Paramecium pentaurelia]
MRYLVFLVLVIRNLGVDPQNDEIFDWPYYPIHNFKTYNGFVDIYNGKQVIHYIFMESITNPENKPLIIQFGGGPGCSSLAGLISGIGPYVRIWGSDKMELTENPYTLHKLGNVLYLDIPAGVGYSELHDDDYQWSDTNTGLDSYEIIKTWLNAFQNYKGRDVWISGVSYSGMYIPCTAEVIVKKNKLFPQDKINLKGIMVGNGVLVNEDEFIFKWNREYLVKRNFLDLVTQNIMQISCTKYPNSASCQRALEREKIVRKNLNPYNVYGYCYGDSSIYHKNNQRNFKDVEDYSCIDDGILNNYFNNPEVKQKLGIPEDKKWDSCNIEIFLNYKRDKHSHTLMKFLFDNNIRILQYSGNADDIISVDYTYAAFKLIDGLTQLSRKPFANKQTQQMAGWIVEYNYLTFYIIRGAGHMVPTDQRANTFQMYEEFLNRE